MGTGREVAFVGAKHQLTRVQLEINHSLPPSLGHLDEDMTAPLSRAEEQAPVLQMPYSFLSRGGLLLMTPSAVWGHCAG